MLTENLMNSWAAEISLSLRSLLRSLTLRLFNGRPNNTYSFGLLSNSLKAYESLSSMLLLLWVIVCIAELKSLKL